MQMQYASLLYSDLGDITSPFFDPLTGDLHVLIQNSGEIVKINESGEAITIHQTGGQPSGAVFDENNCLFVTDIAHGAVLALQEGGRQDNVVSVYEDKPLKGPHSIAYNHGNLFFTDSGPFGETGLHSVTGSVFAITSSPSGQILKPISLENLAYPSGIAITRNGIVFVADMMANRVIRYIQQPQGVYHGSAFVQLSGGIGPSSLAIDEAENLYIAKYDAVEYASEGSILIVSKHGKKISEIIVPAPEVTGITIKDDTLYITEKSTRSIYKAQI